MDIAAFIIFVIIGSACAMSAELVLSRSVPGGFLGTTLVGFLGAWTGASILWRIGPMAAGVPVINSVAGSVTAIFFFFMLTGGFSNTWD